jgi:ribosomal protein L13
MTNHNPQNFANVKTTRASKSGFNRPYFLIDASVKPIGRVASEAARILMGKNRADYSPDVDMGGMVIIINAKDQTFTGKKAERKVYFRYGRRLGSLKSRGYEEAFKLDFKFPLYNAIKKMMPRNRHQDLRVNNRLLIVEDDNHGITAPITVVSQFPVLTYTTPSVKPKVAVEVPTIKASKVEKVAKTDETVSKVDETVVAKFTSQESKVISVKEVKAPKATKKTTGDDLKIVEGIGPKIAELLVSKGIVTFADLADADVANISTILDEAGLSSHKPDTWSQQAVLARDGKFEELETLKKELDGGLVKE